MSSIGKLAKQIVIRATGINDFEQARTGWELIDVVSEEDEQFSDRCELCNQPELKTNYIIQHPLTLSIIKVGSKCIRRFVCFKDIINQEDSNRYFDHQSRKIIARKSIKQSLVGIFAPSIEMKNVNDFRYYCSSILECDMGDIRRTCQEYPQKWNMLLKELRKQYHEIRFTFNKEEMERINAALFNPRTLPIIRSKVKLEPTEGMIKKRHRIQTTLARSDEYKNPLKIVINKKDKDD